TGMPSASPFVLAAHYDCCVCCLRQGFCITNNKPSDKIADVKKIRAASNSKKLSSQLANSLVDVSRRSHNLRIITNITPLPATPPIERWMCVASGNGGSFDGY